ncbi:hypothetical protein [Halobacillus salinus]|uniref:hypothetical protein n=1 Tax=Halobacillus salinus TaxID=192814 RepID=UPI001305153F|nr:hypothetical protein [Halobacillus salinus]
MVKLCFGLGSVSIPVAIFFNQDAVGLLTAMFFMALGAFFTKPRFHKGSGKS